MSMRRVGSNMHVLSLDRCSTLPPSPLEYLRLAAHATPNSGAAGAGGQRLEDGSLGREGAQRCKAGIEACADQDGVGI